MNDRWIWIWALAWLGLTSGAANARNARLVIIISIDGLHQADLSDPALAGQLANLLSLRKEGLSFAHATGPTPADSFPGTLAYLTGATPATTGIYYDDMYFRDLLPGPGNPSNPGSGAQVRNTEAIDRDFDRLDGGGDFGISSINPEKLPLDPVSHQPVYPHQMLKVNTIFEVAHEAGLRTSLLEKHPAYEIAAGPSGKGIDDPYCPEINAPTGIVNGKLLDGTAAPAGTLLTRTLKSPGNSLLYDDLKSSALIREIHGRDARGTAHPGPPALVAINFQAVNVAEKILAGGIKLENGSEVPSQALLDALHHTDLAIANLIQELKQAGLWQNTLLVITSKHGQSPRVGSVHVVGSHWIRQSLESADITIAGLTQDQTALIWLVNPAQSGKAAEALLSLQKSQKNPGIEKILWGDGLREAHLAGEKDRTPDLIVQLKPNVLLLDVLSKRAEHGAFCEDDLHVPLILAGGALDPKSQGVAIDRPVQTMQIGVTVLRALGLNPGKLQGAKIENTQPLPAAP